MWRSGLWLAAAIALASINRSTVHAQDSEPGITQRTTFPAFDPHARACQGPPGLARELAFVQENDREFLEGVNRGLSMAARDRGLAYRRVLADNDATKAADEIRTLRDAKVGAIVATSSNPAVVANSLQEAIWSGSFVGTNVPPPATLLLNAPQYATGKALTDAAVEYINNKLGGTATVVLLTQDTMQFLTPRFEALRDGLGKLPGVTLVADIAPSPVTKQGGFDTMNKILITNSDIDVVLGGDSVVLGALQALPAAGKDRRIDFLAASTASRKRSPNSGRTTVPTRPASPCPRLSSAMRWANMAPTGSRVKAFHRAMDTLPVTLTKDNIAQYEADLVNPAAAYSDPVRRAGYLRMYGNTCYDTHDKYVNFSWSSEQE